MMIMNVDDKRRYEHLRAMFHCGSLNADNSYIPTFASGSLPRAKSLDESIDIAMGVTPTGEKIEEMVPLSLCVGLLAQSAIGVKETYGDLPEGYVNPTYYCVDVGRKELTAATEGELRLLIESAVRELARRK